MTVTVKARTVTGKGPNGGTLTRAFKGNNFAAQLSADGRTMTVDMWFGDRKQIATLRTITSHIENMIKGVTKGFQYKMRFAYSHFPINVTLSKGEGKRMAKGVTKSEQKVKDQSFVEIRNFLGQSRLRKVQLHEGVTVTRSANVKDEIVLEGNSLEKVAGSAANIHESCLIRHKDIRKFLDGLYVSERGVKGETVSLL